MIFDIEYTPGITLVKCTDWGTLTIIISNDPSGLFESIDLYGDKYPEPYYDIKDAMRAAISRATDYRRITHPGAQVIRVNDAIERATKRLAPTRRFPERKHPKDSRSNRRKTNVPTTV